MADYFVAATGSNTAPYDTWAKAATSLQTALTAASTNGDRVIIQHDGVPSGDAELAADTTYTSAADISFIASTNTGTSTITPTAMSTANWIGNSTTNRSITWNCGTNDILFFYGITFRISGATADVMSFWGAIDGVHAEFEDSYFWQGNTNSGGNISLGASTSGSNGYCRMKNCTIRFGNTGQAFQIGHTFEMEGGGVSSDGSAPTTLLTSRNISSWFFTGVDFSHLGSGTLVGSAANGECFVYLNQCKLGASMTLLGTQSPTNKSSNRVWAFDCASGDTHGLFAYSDAYGTLVSDTGIFFTSGAAVQSWKIVTTSACSFTSPFISPFIDSYNTGTSAITPYLEILRDGSATAYQDDEVWGEFVAKTTTTSTLGTFFQDRMAIAGTAADQAAGAGLGSWTGENATSWSGKVDSGSSLTPAENGHIRARVLVGQPSITVYVDPQIRT